MLDSSRFNVYVETSVISYLASKPSRDYVLLARQELTKEWWEVSRNSYNVYISALVENEAKCGDPDAAKKRLLVLQDLKSLELNETAISLAKHLIGQGAVPSVAKEDALHIAIAAVHGMDFLMTWNCTHIANAVTRRKIVAEIASFGFDCPVICTPEELPPNP
jgi:hypothetical protein